MEILMKWDGQLLLWIEKYLRVDWMNGFWCAITFLGDGGWFWILAGLILCFFKQKRKVGFMALLSMAICALIVNVLLKNMVARIRPYEILSDLSILVNKQSDYSFPSGHTTASFASAWIYFKRLDKPLGIMAMILATAIAFSRLYVGVHYPSDVLAGFVIAWGVSFLILWLEERKFKKEN